MDIKLELPYAETYTLGFSQKIFRRKNINEYVYSELRKKHPGFNESSLWDYKIVREKEKRVIKAVVLNRDFYIEKILSQKNVSFYLSEKNEKIKLFSSIQFSKDGTRKKSKLLPIIIFFIFVLLILLLFGNIGRKEKYEENEVTVPEIKTVEVLHLFDVINKFAFIISNHNAKIDLVQFGYGNFGELVFSVTGCEPYSLVKDLSVIENVSECRCDGVVYNGEKEQFEIKAQIIIPSIIQKQANEMELLELQSRITGILKNMDVSLASSAVDRLSGKVGFQFTSERNKLDEINRIITDACYKENLFISSFSESKDNERDLFFINFECILLDNNHRLKKSIIEENLSEVFEEEIVINKKTTELSNTPIPQVSNNPLKNYKKIGSAKKEGKTQYYYRTEEGKILVSEENYE